SAKGKYPSETVKIMAQICERTDNAMWQRNPTHVERFTGDIAITESICKSAVNSATDLKVDLIVVSTLGGKSVKSVRKYFPKAYILALTTNEKTAQQLCLTKGVRVERIEPVKSVDDIQRVAKKLAVATGIVSTGDRILIVSGALVPGGSTNNVAVHRI